MSPDFINDNALEAGRSEGQKIWVERFHFNINLKERNRHVFVVCCFQAGFCLRCLSSKIPPLAFGNLCIIDFNFMLNIFVIKTSSRHI